jgi:hypothetical protein
MDNTIPTRLVGLMMVFVVTVCLVAVVLRDVGGFYPSSSDNVMFLDSAKKMPVTTDSFAPIFMQQAGTGEAPLALILAKYGYTGTSKTSKKNLPSKKAAASSRSSSSSATSWVVASISGNNPDAKVTPCGGKEYFNAGIALDTCLPLGQTSMVLTCNDGEIAVYKYAGDMCDGDAYASSVVASEGCSTDPSSTPWGSLQTDDEYGRSISYSCVTTSADSDGPDVGESPNRYAVLKAYLTLSCSSSSYSYFESYAGDVCIPLTLAVDGDMQEDASIEFKPSDYSVVAGKKGNDADAGGVYMKLYGADRKCVGAQTTKELSSDCLNGAQWSYVDYSDSSAGKKGKQ